MPFTLNRSLSFLPDWMGLIGSAPAGVRLAGWFWQPEFLSPAYYLVTLPLRWLPERLIPLATNSFSALCGALALAQLARSVALLPHDRTRDQRDHASVKQFFLNVPLAWLPPIFAVLVCGLQLSFWEHATNGTVEMFDLLLFSYVVRSLLEYRIDLQEGRLVPGGLCFRRRDHQQLRDDRFLPVVHRCAGLDPPARLSSICAFWAGWPCADWLACSCTCCCPRSAV